MDRMHIVMPRGIVCVPFIIRCNCVDCKVDFLYLSFSTA